MEDTYACIYTSFRYTISILSSIKLNLIIINATGYKFRNDNVIYALRVIINLYFKMNTVN